MRKQEIDYIMTSISEIFDDVSDIDVTVGNPFRVERFGQLIGVEIDPPFYELTPFQTEIFALNLISQDRLIMETLLKKGACRFSYSISENMRFDVNISLQRKHYTILIRKETTARKTKSGELNLSDTPGELSLSDTPGELSLSDMPAKLNLPDTLLDMMIDTTEKMEIAGSAEKETARALLKSKSEFESADVEESAELDIDLDDIDLDDIHEFELKAETKDETDSLDLDLEIDSEEFSESGSEAEEEEEGEEKEGYFDDTMDEGDLTQVFEIGIPGTNFQVKEKKDTSPLASHKPFADEKTKSAEKKKSGSSLGVFKKLGRLFGGRSSKAETEEYPEFFKPRRHGSPESYPENKDAVDCTIFCPLTVKGGTALLLRVFVHLVELVSEFTDPAGKSGEDTAHKGFSNLETDIERGSELTFELSIRGVKVEHPIQRLNWEGKTVSADYEVEIPAKYPSGNLSGKVIISQSSIPVGHIRFKLKVIGRKEEDPPEKTPKPVGEAKRYKYAFLSYAPEEHSEVLRSVLMLSSMKVSFSQESLRLNPQERWKRKLYLEIDKADVFFLFWSTDAYKSEWVKREVIYALRKKQGNDENPPEIIPVIKESAPAAPKELKYLHFSERPAYFTSARL